MTAEVVVPAAAAAAAAAAATHSNGKEHPPITVSVADAIAAMASAVQQGDFAAAEAVGAGAPVNLALPRAALRNRRPLSEGAQAAVFAAELCPARLVATLDGMPVSSSNDGSDGSLPVAVKKAIIRESADLDRLRREAALLAALRQHPHVVRLLGARLLPPDYSLVLQLEASNAEAQLHGAGWRPSWSHILRLGAQLASALAALHALGYVHRDVKPANVLLDGASTHARLADLGLAAALDELAGGASAGSVHGKPTGGFHKQRMVGTLQYMSPEVLLGSAPQSPASDVFALAVTLNELAAGVVPYSDCTRDNPLAHTVLEMGYGRQELAAAVAAEGLRPTLRGDTPPALTALLAACWSADPCQRPPAAELAARLEAMAADAEAAEAAAAGCSFARPLHTLPGQQAEQLCTSPSPSRGCAAEQGLGVSLHQLHDVEMEEAEGEVELGSPSALVGTSPSSSACPSPSRGSSIPPDSLSGSSSRGGILPAWLPAGSAAGAGAGATFSSAQHSGGSAADAAAAVHVGSFLTAGKRDSMEDTVVVLPDAFRAAAAAAPACTALGVFDGHRGAAAADYLAAQLGTHLAGCLPGSRSAGDLLAHALADADVAFRAQQDAEWTARVARMGVGAAGVRPAPGATATLLLLYPGGGGSSPAAAAAAGQHQGQGDRGGQQGQLMLAVANLGDSRVVLCRDGQAVPLTRDHTADLPDERARVAAAGGACSVRAGGWRVGDAGLQVTRSVGDADLKGQGVTAEAETAELALGPGDSFLIAATDGLWDRISNEEAVALVLDTVKHPAMCAQRLVTEALARGSADNVACLVAFFSGSGASHSTAERVYHAGHLKYGGGASAKHATGVVSADELQDTY